MQQIKLTTILLTFEMVGMVGPNWSRFSPLIFPFTQIIYSWKVAAYSEERQSHLIFLPPALSTHNLSLLIQRATSRKATKSKRWSVLV